MNTALWSELIATLLYLIPASVLVTTAGCMRLLPEAPAAGLALTAGLMVLILTLLIHLKKRGRRIVLAILAEFLAVTLLILWRRDLWARAAANTWILWEVGFCLLGFLLTLLIRHFRPVRIGAGVLLFGGLIACMILEAETDRLTCASALFLILLCVMEEVQILWKKGGYTDRKKHLAALSPFLVGLMAVFLVFRAPAEPYDWQFFIDLYQSTVTFLDRTTANVLSGFGDSYEGSLVGFSGTGRLAGHVRKSPEDILRLSGDSMRGDVILLAGKIFDTYEDREWKNTVESDINYRTYDLLESISAVLKYDGDYMRDYLRRKNVRLTHTNFRSRFIFSPLKPIITESTFSRYHAAFSGGYLLAEKKINNDESYDLQFYQVNRREEQITGLMASLTPMTAEDMEKAVKKLGFPVTDYSYDDYLRCKEEALQKNSEKPELTERVRLLLEEIVSGAENDYEKLDRLEKHFSNYEFTNDPGKIPKSVKTAGDFLDYFLFENPRGFCSYYAAAFVLMSRAMDIPARFVQGYYVPMSTGAYTNVSTADAHAWPECYLEGFGWLSFEPTPGYEYEISWAPASREPVSEGSGSGFSERPDLEELNHLIPELPEQEEEEELEPVFAIDRRLLLMYAGILAATLLLLLVLQFVFLQLRFRRKDDRSQALVMFRRNLRLLEMLGYTREENETLSELRSRAAQTVGDHALDFIDCYESLLYADGAGVEKLRRRAVISNEYMAEELKKARGLRYGFLYLSTLYIV